MDILFFLLLFFHMESKIEALHWSVWVSYAIEINKLLQGKSLLGANVGPVSYTTSLRGEEITIFSCAQTHKSISIWIIVVIINRIYIVKVKHNTFERKNGTTYVCKYMYKMLHESPKHSLYQAGCRFLHIHQTLKSNFSHYTWKPITCNHFKH